MIKGEFPSSEIRAAPLPASGPTALPLGVLASAASVLEGFRRHDLEPGDRLVVATRNSIYCLVARADGRFLASGGWFARHPEAGVEQVVAVQGCTIGGHAIFTDIVAAPGMFLEFEASVRTTRISSVRRIRA
jgi:hypothetical protein